MFLRFQVGTNEQHVVRLDYDMLNSRVSIYVDDALLHTIILTGKPNEVRFQVGNEEKHEVLMFIRGKTIPVTTVYVDGVLLGTFR